MTTSVSVTLSHGVDTRNRKRSHTRAPFAESAIYGYAPACAGCWMPVSGGGGGVSLATLGARIPVGTYVKSGKAIGASVTSSTTLADSGAAWTDLAIGNYELFMPISYVSSAGGAIKLQVTAGSNTTVEWSAIDRDSGSLAMADGATSISYSGSTSRLRATVLARVTVAGGIGSVKLQFAQNASSGTATVLSGVGLLVGCA